MENRYNVLTIAQRYNVDKKTVWKWVRDKKISAIRVGKSYFFTDEDLRAFEGARRTIVRKERK